MLKAFETLIENRYRAFDDGTILEGIDVTRMNFFNTFTRFWTRAVARYAFTINRFLFSGTSFYTSSVIFQQMLGALSYASSPVRVFPIGICFPRISGRIVSEKNTLFSINNYIAQALFFFPRQLYLLLHRRAFLSADPVVEEIFTS